MSKNKIKPPKEKKSLFPQAEKLRPYIKYTNMAFSLAGACLLGYLLGAWLDDWTQTEKPYWTAACVSFFAIAYIAKVIIDLTRS
jgi:hypothetical protein